MYAAKWAFGQFTAEIQASFKGNLIIRIEKVAELTKLFGQREYVEFGRKHEIIWKCI